MLKDFFKKFDVLLLLTTVAIVTIGIIAIYSASFSNEGDTDYYKKQMMFAIVGFVLMIVINYVPSKYLSNTSYILYAISLLGLIAVLVVGKKISGQRSWFSIGSFGIQPSEFAKLATIMALGRFFAAEDKERDIKNPKTFIIAALIVLAPVALIMKQPDMGTVLVFLAMTIPIFFWAGLPTYVVFAIVSPAIVAVCSFFGLYYMIGALVLVAIVLYMWFKQRWIIALIIMFVNIAAGLSVDYVYGKLQPYQQRRIMAVFDPTSDPLGSGYNVIQSKVAIGSGGLMGKGYLQGTQTQLKFIPEQWTDFIFCMVGEEFGFIGAIVLLILYFIIIFQLINSAYFARNKFLSICCIGFATVFLFHLFVNIGMTVGIMPVIGIPLPLVSYGVSSLLSFMMMLGIGMNAYRNRKLYM
ncbi:MAG: rod shape-determining protein RodA [Ignavibacteriae bacterium]|nr:rod shape-determining protein RodA [Ignavibacteriota bacterium]MCB9243007.1 rod shape-determining protein RodA [Ignavibacteriales bacterium]